VGRLKGQSGRDIVVWGSISLAQSLVNDGLIDEYRLVVCPVVLASGRPLFSDKVAAIDMDPLNAMALDRGAVSLKYIPAPGGLTPRGGPANV
jgi:dihydrofolate reductase